jgi:phospholipid transport system substrate-binding protein
VNGIARAGDRFDFPTGGSPMVRYLTRVVWALMLVLMLSPVHGAGAGAPSDQLRAGIDRVFKILGDPALEGDAKVNQRRTAIVSAANEIFDFGEMAKRSLGEHWAQRTPAERGEFVRLFTELVQRSYISKVDQHGADKMTVQGEKLEGDYAVVRTTLPLGQGREMPIDYRMHSTADRWQVYDLGIDGISLVANYRAQFNKIIRTSSYETLVARFKSHQAEFPAAPVPPGGKAAR